MRDLYDEMQQEWYKDAQTISADPSGLESSRVPGSSESLEYHETLESTDDSDIDSALDIEEISEAIIAGERDDLEVTGLKFLSSKSGKAQIEVSRVSECASDTSTRKRMFTPQHDPAYRELTQLEIQTQMSLLNRRLYQGTNWVKNKKHDHIYGILVWLHSVIPVRIRGFYLRDNKDGIIVQAKLAQLGERHPNVFVISERTDDPASRLAFRVTLKDEKGDQKVVYLTSGRNSLEVIFKANSLVD
jgi:hypothetical protein